MRDAGPVVHETALSSLPLVARGKVRDIYAVGDEHLLIVATDRISAFDVVLPDPIPGKGAVLTALTEFWFERTERTVRNHRSSLRLEDAVPDPRERAILQGRSVVADRLRPLPIEAIVRGYLIGSGWKDYQESGAVCGIALPRGLRQADRLPEPLFTPSTKAEIGAHDENIEFDRMASLVGSAVAERVRSLSLALYRDAARYARERGIIIADTKLEFGLDGDGSVVLIDEVLTPDSSRFWPAAEYAPGASPPSFDKQYVRDYLESLGWNKRPPAPVLPAEVVNRTAAKYRSGSPVRRPDSPVSPEPHPYSRLTPDLVLDAIERFGFRCTGALLPLSSYENRVYLAETEDSDGVVAKFYRPERWSDAAIVEEHAFALELAAREIPVVAPLPLEEGKGATSGAHGPTLVEHGGFRVAVYPRQRGHFPELDDPQTLEWVGRFLGRIHAVAATASFIHRPMVSMERLGYEPLEYLRGSEMVPHEARGRYAAAAERLLAAIAGRMDAIGPVRRQRLHGDCHAGNVLWTESGPFFVDLDDCCTGPTVQDLWMLLSGERWEMEAQLAHILRGYRQFHTFEAHELALIEPLRGLRAVHYAAWLARRWADPAFPKAFPWFGTHRYWEDQCVQLDEQLERLDLVIDAQ